MIDRKLLWSDLQKQVALVEELGQRLRALDVTTFLSHVSLSVDERRRAEEAFAQERDCVIVATSTLELGIDVGDLDLVIQVDAPRSVAAFVQRIGRTGRRPGSARNCLFLALDGDGLLQAAGLLHGRITGPGQARHRGEPLTLTFRSRLRSIVGGACR